MNAAFILLGFDSPNEKLAVLRDAVYHEASH